MTSKSKPHIRLLACDLDGTLMAHDSGLEGRDLGRITERVQQAMALAGTRGVQITLATGRSFQSTLPYAQALKIDLPLICYQGGLIQYAGTGKILYQAALAPELVEESIDLGQAHGWQLILYMRDEVLLTEYRHSAEEYRHLLGPTVRKVTDFKAALVPVSQVGEDGRPLKLTFMAAEAEIATIEAEMNRRFAGRMEILRSHPNFVEGIPPGVSKKDALVRVAKHLGIPRREVMAIGDQDNDASMVAWAGLGVTMGNGSPRCKKAADWIAPPIEQDGAAVAIEHFLL